MLTLPGWLVTALNLVAWGGLLVIVYAYVGYPLLAWLIVRPRRTSVASATTGTAPDLAPKLSVLIAARNEAGVIVERLQNLLAQDYPPDQLELLVASDASDDGTDELVRSIDDPRVRLLRQEPRQGKTAAINRLGCEATGELLVQTDANVSFAPGTLRALAAPFAAPEVGLVMGEVQFTNVEQHHVAGGEGLYWRWETWVKRIESSRGLLAVANGGIYALRRNLWEPLPAQIAGDAAEPLLVARRGYQTVVAPAAVALEKASASLGEEYARKVRIIAQQVACARQIGLRSLPGRTLFAYLSHKLLRYLVPLFALLSFVAASVAALGGSRVGLMALALLLLPVCLALLASLPLPGLLGRAAHAARYLLVINVAALAGLQRGLSGAAPAVWETPSSTR